MPSKLKMRAKYRQTIMDEILNDEEILKAVANNQENFLDYPAPKPNSLSFKNIFPFLYVPEGQSKAETFITIKLGKFHAIDNKYKAGFIYILVFTHFSLMKTDYEGLLRPDYIADKIDQIMNKSRKFGLGELQSVDEEEIKVEKEYSGIMLTYKDVSFA